MKKIVLVAVSIIAFLYQDWLNGNVIYYLYCTDTDVMYIEYCTSGYNSAVVPIYKPDGTMLTYSEWIEKR